MKNLDYEEMKSYFLGRIQTQNSMVLATSYKDHVTARMVYCASDGTDIYVMTSKAYKKYKQMEKNPRVALCFDNIQIEGIVTFMGHPGMTENKNILQNLTNATDSFLAYAKYKNTEFIKIEITLIESWNNRGREFTDFTSQVSYRIG